MSGPTRQTARDELTVPALLAEATQQMGHDDFGDEGFLQPLGLLLDGSRGTGELTPDGRRVLRSVVLRHLRNRLRVAAHRRRRAEVAERSLGAPLVITGLPRTGTTLLQNLLARDPRHRFLRLWEALHPVPPGAGTGPDEDELVERAERWLERFYEHAPAFEAVHPLTARGPEECDALLQNAFASQHFEDMFDAPDYSRWFHRGDLSEAYADYALQLRVLSGDLSDRRWLLKSPGHLGHLDALLEVLPHARVVHCHRDPARQVASYASLIRTVRAPNTGGVDARAVGDQALQRCAATVGRVLKVRDTLDTDRVHDVSFARLVADPLQAVGRIYAWLDESLDEATEDGMRRWLAAHPRDQRGVHRYDPVEFGLPPERVRAALSEYLDRFGDVLRVRR